MMEPKQYPTTRFILIGGQGDGLKGELQEGFLLKGIELPIMSEKGWDGKVAIYIDSGRSNREGYRIYWMRDYGISMRYLAEHPEEQ